MVNFQSSCTCTTTLESVSIALASRVSRVVCECCRSPIQTGAYRKNSLVSCCLSLSPTFVEAARLSKKRHSTSNSQLQTTQSYEHRPDLPIVLSGTRPFPGSFTPLGNYVCLVYLYILSDIFSPLRSINGDSYIAECRARGEETVWNMSQECCGQPVDLFPTQRLIPSSSMILLSAVWRDAHKEPSMHAIVSCNNITV
jgi:hypothetical protein